MQAVLFLVRFIIISSVLFILGAMVGPLGVVELTVILALGLAGAWLLGRSSPFHARNS